ncbi:MAG TPA: hypothetical protein VIR56_03570 [Solimonas sp.]
MKSLTTFILWILIALLPLTGYASTVANGCALHHLQQATMHHHANDMAISHAAMQANMHQPSMPDHGNCHGAVHCIAQCAGASTLTSLSIDFALNAARSEAPATASRFVVLTSPIFDLLRPPKRGGF